MNLLFFQLNNMGKYTLVISGAIGAGKSTMLGLLRDYFKRKRVWFAIVPEYLEGMTSGGHILDAWTQGRITLSEFNHYIMDAVDTLNRAANGYPIRILERAPIENAWIFANKEPGLLLQAHNIHHKYNIPLVTTKDCPVSVLNANLDAEAVFQNLINIVEEDINENVPNRVIYLRISAETSKNGVSERGRKEEQSYTEEYLASIVKKYEDLFFNTKNDNKTSNQVGGLQIEPSEASSTDSR